MREMIRVGHSHPKQYKPRTPLDDITPRNINTEEKVELTKEAVEEKPLLKKKETK